MIRDGHNPDARSTDDDAPRLSYKFQRLREQIRRAISSGEFRGKLPGERQLARRFRVNAKTLSKALTDLAGEGLLDRSIGRGTFVKGAVEQHPSGDRWLIICDPAQASANVIRMLQQANPNSQVVTSASNLRPSYLNQFKAVVNFSWETSYEFLRSLVVRNLNVVLVNREPKMLSINSVLVDRAPGAWSLARDLLLWGHRRLLAIEAREQTEVSDAVRNAVRQYDSRAIVQCAQPAEAPDAISRDGITAIICGALPLAKETRQVLDQHGVEMPARVSLGAVAAGIGQYPCSGYYVPAESKAEAILQLLRDPLVKRPATLWLRGQYVDLGTTGPAPTRSIRPDSHQPAHYDQLSA